MCASAVGSDRDPWSASVNGGVLFLLGVLAAVVSTILYALWRRARLAPR
jgi:hypothetical protein